MAKPYVAKKDGRRVDAYIYGSKSDPKPKWFDEKNLKGINVKNGDVVVCDESTGALITVTSQYYFDADNTPVDVPAPSPLPSPRSRPASAVTPTPVAEEE